MPLIIFFDDQAKLTSRTVERRRVAPSTLKWTLSPRAAAGVKSKFRLNRSPLARSFQLEKGHLERRSSSRSFFDPNAAAMLFQQLFGDGEP
jgi:hypothetical protein